MPFDNEFNNPINSSVPTEIMANELVEYCNSNPDIGKFGLFIAHKKNPSGGFIRYVATSTNPLLLESAIFDNDFKKIKEIKGITASSIDSFGKGSSMMGRFGLFDK